jgi:hypothetical protein
MGEFEFNSDRLDYLSSMDFGKCARKTLNDPCAIRRVEEASTTRQPISKDDVLNLIIELNNL